jgi:hypothetical protein
MSTEKICEIAHPGQTTEGPSSNSSRRNGDSTKVAEVDKMMKQY